MTCFLSMNVTGAISSSHDRIGRLRKNYVRHEKFDARTCDTTGEYSCRMLKKSASGVLTSLRGSTLKGTVRRSETLVGLLRSPRTIRGVNGHTKCGVYLLTSSLAAALPGTKRVPGRRGCLGRLRAGGCSSRRGWAGEKSGHFEHPENLQSSASKGKF